MAALRPRPSVGLVVGTPRPVGTSSLRIIVQPLGRRGGSASFHSLKTSTGRHRHAIGAEQGPSGLDPDERKRRIEENLKIWRAIFKGHLELDEDMPFREDVQKIEEYDKAMDSCTSIFHIEASAYSSYFCMIASKGVKLASNVMESAALRFDKQDEVSSCTAKQTLVMYVSIFVALVKDVYDEKFNSESIFALFGAFRGVAAVGHILLQDVLANFNDAGYSSSNYGTVVLDAESVWCEFEQKMNNLEAKFRAVSNSTKAYEILRPTMTDAMKFTSFYISAMVTYHERTLGYVPGTKGRKRSIKASGDGDPGAFGTSSGSM